MLGLAKGDVRVDHPLEKQPLELILVEALDEGVGDGLLFWVVGVEFQHFDNIQGRCLFFQPFCECGQSFARLINESMLAVQMLLNILGTKSRKVCSFGLRHLQAGPTNPFSPVGRVASLNIEAMLPNPRCLPASTFRDSEAWELIPWEGLPMVG